MENYQNNILFMYHEHDKKIYLFLLIIIPSIVILFLLLLMPIDEVKEYPGIYNCDKECFLHTLIPLDDVNSFTKNTYIVLGEEKFSLNVLKFGEASFVENTLNQVQSLDIIIPKNIYFENQVVTFKVLFKREPLLKVFWKFMKGGDES